MHRTKLLVPLLCVAIAGAAPALAEAASGTKLRGGATTLALDPGTAAALSSAGISVGPIRPASARAAGIAFPITRGRVATGPVGGRIAHSGGLLLRDAGTAVRLRKFVIRLDAAPDLTANVGKQRVSILDLDLSQAQLALQRRRLSVSGVKATLSAAGAAALNEAFGLQLPAGLAIGTASVEAKLGGGDDDSDSDD